MLLQVSDWLSRDAAAAADDDDDCVRHSITRWQQQHE